MVSIAIRVKLSVLFIKYFTFLFASVLFPTGEPLFNVPNRNIHQNLTNCIGIVGAMHHYCRLFSIFQAGLGLNNDYFTSLKNTMPFRMARRHSKALPQGDSKNEI